MKQFAWVIYLASSAYDARYFISFSWPTFKGLFRPEFQNEIYLFYYCQFAFTIVSRVPILHTILIFIVNSFFYINFIYLFNFSELDSWYWSFRMYWLNIYSWIIHPGDDTNRWIDNGGVICLAHIHLHYLYILCLLLLHYLHQLKRIKVYKHIYKYKNYKTTSAVVHVKILLQESPQKRDRVLQISYLVLIIIKNVITKKNKHDTNRNRLLGTYLLLIKETQKFFRSRTIIYLNCYCFANG